MSDAIPHLHEVADELCVIRSMNTDQFNHAPAELLVFTGSPRSGRPSLGSWVTYGLGSENENLPGFVVLISSGVQPNGGKNSFGSGFLPSVYQGVQCRSKGDPVLYVSDPQGMNREMRRLSLDALRDLNELQASELGHPETRTRIAQYELAFRMQTSVPEVMDISQESQTTLDAYGAQPGESSLANNCLLARRLVEAGVRFVQLFDWGWDFHGTNPSEDIRDGLTNKCATMDKPVAALIKDLRAARSAGRNADHLGRRVRTYAISRRTDRQEPGARTRPFPGLLHHVARRWWCEGGLCPRRIRRTRLLRCARQGARTRPAGHLDAPAGLQPREAHLPLPRPRLPAHRRCRKRCARTVGITHMGRFFARVRGKVQNVVIDRSESNVAARHNRYRQTHLKVVATF